jgi:hypothetical protein
MGNAPAPCVTWISTCTTASAPSQVVGMPGYETALISLRFAEGEPFPWKELPLEVPGSCDISALLGLQIHLYPCGEIFGSVCNSRIDARSHRSPHRCEPPRAIQQRAGEHALAREAVPTADDACSPSVHPSGSGPRVRGTVNPTAKGRRMRTRPPPPRHPQDRRLAAICQSLVAGWPFGGWG